MFKHIELRNRLNALNSDRTKRKLKQETKHETVFGENNDIALLLIVGLIIFTCYCLTLN